MVIIDAEYYGPMFALKNKNKIGFYEPNKFTHIIKWRTAMQIVLI